MRWINVSEIQNHIKENNKNRYFKYDGLNLNEFDNVLFIKNYDLLLQKIGYIEVTITHKSAIKFPFIAKQYIGRKMMLPPNIINEKNVSVLFDNNVKILENNINNLCNSFTINN